MCVLSESFVGFCSENSEVLASMHVCVETRLYMPGMGHDGTYRQNHDDFVTAASQLSSPDGSVKAHPYHYELKNDRANMTVLSATHTHQ